MEDYGYDLQTTLKEFYNSATFEKLSDEAIGLYIKSSVYVYEILKNKWKYGKLTILSPDSTCRIS